MIHFFNKFFKQAFAILLITCSIFQYSLATNEEIYDNEDVCAICFDAIPTEPAIELSCGHKFHKSCISKWLQSNKIDGYVPEGCFSAKRNS